ncbi:sugar ABC transporter substrate-binding protein [Vibrio sinaloensis]|uniref:sugar ABC transporter substrate-binding protein n=1 Tax=Photobacterium sp. (strain ATCC 43367) TaxID=379097 RepID=UPI00205D4397|nr:extracellular solute-binding protein [Vibrio sinaloensis]UPQ87992.1 extracellular solute-binding protein [Vibrio sinaloensis]
MRVLFLSMVYLLAFAVRASDLEIWSGVDFGAISAARQEVEQQTQSNIVIRDFDVNNIRSELLIANQNGGALPDAIWIPSDFIGLKQFFGIAAIPDQWIQKDKMEHKAIELVTLDDKLYAMPLVLGNHLVLYINTNLTSDYSLTWEQLLDDADNSREPLLAMQHPTMYFLMAFASLFNPHMTYATDIDSETLSKTFSFYRLLTQAKVVEAACDQYCATEQFISGKRPYLIDGDWANAELKQHLGHALKAGALPTYRGRPMRSLSGGRVLAVTERAMENPDKREQIKRLINVMQSPEFIQDVIVKNKLISAFKALNKQPNQDDSTLAADIYQQLDNALVMPSSLTMAVMWEVLYHGYKRHEAGMPAPEAAQFTIDFMNRELEKINAKQARVNP